MKRAALLALLATGCTTVSTEKTLHAKSGVQITQLPGKLRVEINGQLFTEYNFKDVPRPFFYPVM